MSTPTLYYTSSSKEANLEMPAVPVLLSAASFTRLYKNGYGLMRPRLPYRVMERAADCGGFVATMKWGGTYRFSPVQYIDWLLKWQPQWAATMDLLCIDEQTYGYPGKGVVEERQRFTTDKAREFWERYRSVPWAWVPTIQGFYPEEYERHARKMAPLIRKMAEFYYELQSWQDEDDEQAVASHYFRVGIGGLCRRAKPLWAHDLMNQLWGIIGIDISFHLWGMKLGFLKCERLLRSDISMDTNAWNGLWGEEHEKRRKSKMTERDYSWLVSYPAYAQKVEAALNQPKQLSWVEPAAAKLSPRRMFDLNHEIADS